MKQSVQLSRILYLLLFFNGGRSLQATSLWCMTQQIATTTDQILDIVTRFC